MNSERESVSGSPRGAAPRLRKDKRIVVLRMSAV